MTFGKAGTYGFIVSASDGAKNDVSAVTVTVSQATTTVTVDGKAMTNGDTQTFSATAYDQFGDALAAQPTFTWSVLSGGVGGSIGSSTGSYTAPSSGTGSDTIQATGNGVSGTALAEVGKLAGSVFYDLDSGGAAGRSANEPGLSGFRVYLDMDDSGTYNVGEPYKDTDASGNFAFLDKATDIVSNKLRVAGQANWSQTFPMANGGAYDFTGVNFVNAGASVAGLIFGMAAAAPAAPSITLRRQGHTRRTRGSNLQSPPH